ncbi:MAG: hypothetical protein ACOX56_04610 [Acholeplasmataceae bacterium]|jgi:NitT/TauT family transport system substrate-binding protein
MKKYFIFLLALLTLTLFGCQKNTEKPTVILPAGSPLISVADILDEACYQIVPGPDAFPAEFKKQEKDIIIAPVIVGTKLYIAGASNYKLHAIIGWGNLYLVSRTKVNRISDLTNKKVIAFGENATPGIIFKTALGNQSTEVDYYAAVSDVVGPFKTKQYDYALISEPVLQRLISTSTNETLHVFDLSSVENLPKVAQFGVFVNPTSSNSREVTRFLKKIEPNVKSLNQDPLEYANKIITNFEQLSSFTPELLASSIPRMNLKYVKAKAAQEDFLVYINFLNEKNPNLIGGKVPNEGFYD